MILEVIYTNGDEIGRYVAPKVGETALDLCLFIHNVRGDIDCFRLQEESGCEWVWKKPPPKPEPVCCLMCGEEIDHSIGTCDFCGVPIPLKAGHQSYGDECGVRWIVLSREAVENYLSLDTDMDEAVAYSLSGWSESYGGPGRAFTGAPTMRIFKHKVLIRQRVGLDI